MRVEKIKKGYAKIPDKLETEIVKQVKQYVNTVKNSGNNYIPDREALVQEIILRMYPATAKLAGDISRREIIVAINNLLEALDLSGIIVGTDIEFLTVNRKITASDSKDIIMIPSDIYMNIKTGEMFVKINGMEQRLNTHYSYIVDLEANPERLAGLDFGDPGVGDEIFEVGDQVEIQWRRAGKDRFARINF